MKDILRNHSYAADVALEINKVNVRIRCDEEIQKQIQTWVRKVSILAFKYSVTKIGYQF